MLEQIQTLARQMSRIADTHVEFQCALGEIKVAVTEVRSDVIENHNLTRHNEILETLHRLDKSDHQRADQAFDRMVHQVENDK